MITSRLTELLELQHPIIAAPMAGVAGADLAQAVSKAGGLGLVGGGYGEQGWLEQQLLATDCRDIGVGFITWRLKEQPSLLDLALDYEPKAIFLSFGDMGDFAPKIMASSCHFIAQVQSVNDALEAATIGADVIVAQGTEAGGHGAARATLPLVPAVVDAVAPIPVVAAGGIADGRGLAAALMLGASGVVMGTRFYCSQESLAPQAAIARAIASSGDHTVRSSVFDVLREFDWPAPYKLRTLVNDMTLRFATKLNELRVDKLTQIESFNTAIDDANYEVAAVIVGEALDLVNDIPSAADIVIETMHQAETLIRRAPNFEIHQQ